jgi:flagellar hook-basal body complex protein FliE
MRIEPTDQLIQQAGILPKDASSTNFSEIFMQAMDSVSAAQTRANESARRVAEGDLSSLHGAILAMEEASRGLELLMQVRNKVLEAYQEVMRTQI